MMTMLRLLCLAALAASTPAAGQTLQWEVGPAQCDAGPGIVSYKGLAADGGIVITITCGPAVEWTLTKADVSGSTVADVTGSGNAAAVVGGPLTFGASGGVSLSGSQYVHSHMAAAWPALTVSVWFNASNLSSGNPRIVSNSHTDLDAKGFQLMFNGGGGSGYFDVGNGTAEGRAYWTQQLVAGTWYHYVGTYDGTTVGAYLNGARLATAPLTGAVAAGATDVAVGCDLAYGGDCFTGAVSDVRLYPRAMSAAEVSALYKAGRPQ